jgi:hypothetical protein
MGKSLAKGNGAIRLPFELRRKMERDRKWTQAMRTDLDAVLVKLFGPHHTWEAASYPSRAKRSEYNQFRTEFASRHGVSIGAVDQQMRYAMEFTKRPGVSERKAHWDPSRVATAFRNLIAALEAGFIREKDLPYCVATDSPTIDFLDLRPHKPRGRPFTIDDL